jgi:hypothetical protein
MQNRSERNSQVADEVFKAIPSGAPPATGVEARLARDFKATVTPEASRVRLSIHGGVSDERFDLDLEASGQGEMKCDLACAMSRRHVETAMVGIEPERVVDIVDELRALKLRAEPVRQGGFPPCSLIGQLDVELEGESTTVFFMADPEQAKMAGYEPPGEIARAVEMLYEAAEKGLGLERVRP